MFNILKKSFPYFVLIILAFSLRWGYVTNSQFNQPVRSDAYNYFKIGKNLAFDHVFNSSFKHNGKSRHEARPPGYPFFLAAIFKITNSPQAFYKLTLIIQCLLGALTVALTYKLTCYLVPPIWSMLAAFLITISPHMITMSAFLLTESLFTFLFVLAIFLTTLAYQKDKYHWYLLAGLTFSLAIFVRPTLAVAPLLCAALIFYLLRGDKKPIQILTLLAIFLASSFAIPAGWSTWKNITLGPDNAQSAQLKTAVVCGLYPQITYKHFRGFPYREDPNYNQIAQKGYIDLVKYTFANIVNDPARHLGWWLFGKPQMFWSWKMVSGDGVNVYPMRYTWFEASPILGKLKSLMLEIHPLLVILGFSSIFFFWKKQTDNPAGKATFALCFIVIFHTTLMFMVLAPFPRYALPLGPALYILSVFSLYEISKLIKQKLVEA
ncbi:MAG TPA: hypothetical protein DCX54_02200 [Flavobacteriales bacterium]|nr:hypothetical protein [Flavobacteriales bacterium]